MAESIRVAVWAVIVREGALLLVEFDEPGIDQPHHFNLPGGGLEVGETLHEAVRREVYEETTAEIEVGRLLFIYEYVPGHPHHNYGPRQLVRPTYLCMLKSGSQPRLPAHPDPFQIGVRWVPLEQLERVPLLPPIGPLIWAALASS